MSFHFDCSASPNSVLSSVVVIEGSRNRFLKDCCVMSFHFDCSASPNSVLSSVVVIEGSCDRKWRRTKHVVSCLCGQFVCVRKVELSIDDDDIDMQRFRVVMSQGTAASTRLGSTCTMGMKSVN